MRKVRELARAFTDDERSAVERFVAVVREALPEQGASGVLFGSRARGEGGVDSDVDLLVTVRTDDLSVRRQIFDLAYEVFLQTDVFISPLVLSHGGLAALKRGGRRLAKDIERDGVPV